MKLKEVRKEDDYYYNGCFWVVANSYRDILMGNFTLISDKYLVDYEGNELLKTDKKSKIHQDIWNRKYKNTYGVDYTYYPRGRVSFYKGEYFINITPKINLPEIIDKITKEYEISRIPKDKVFIKDEDTEHYKFQLK